MLDGLIIFIQDFYSLRNAFKNNGRRYSCNTMQDKRVRKVLAVNMYVCMHKLNRFMCLNMDFDFINMDMQQACINNQGC